MGLDRRLLLVLVIFLALSVFISWKSFVTDGNFFYRDHWTLFDMRQLAEYMPHLFKSYGVPNLDMLKRVPELWIHLFIDYETYDKFEFALLAFAAFASSFFVVKEILDGEGADGSRAYAIAFLAAFFYVVNPFYTQILLRYYAAINYAVFPVFFYSLFAGFTRPDRRLVFVSALLSSFMFMMVVHSALHTALALFAVSLVSFRRPAGLRGLALNWALFALAFLASAAFVLLPYLYLSRTTGVFAGAWGLETDMLDNFSNVMKLPNAMLLDYNVFWWPYIDYGYPGGSAFFVLSFLFCGAVLVNSFFERDRWSVASLAALAILYFFSKGNSPPFGLLYELLNFALPSIGWLLRVPVKFLYPIPFFFSLLLMRASLRAARFDARALYALGLMAMLFLSAFSWPLFTGDMGGRITKSKTQYEPNLKALNEYLQANGPSAAIYLGKEESRGRDRSNTAEKSIHSDILRPGPFMLRELNAYSDFGNWTRSGWIAGTGATYIIWNVQPDSSFAPPSAPVFSNDLYSLYRVGNGSDIIASAAGSSLCYCHFDTARSVTRSPPAGIETGLLLFPYADYNFQEAYLDSADYVIMDSAPLVLPSVQKKLSTPFSYTAYAADSSRGWVPVSGFGDAGKLAGGEEWAWNWEPELNAGFAATRAAAKESYGAAAVREIPVWPLELQAADAYSAIDGATVTKLPHKVPVSSLVTAALPLEPGAAYNLTLGADVRSDGKTTFDVLLFDQYGSLLGRHRLFGQNGSASLNSSVAFSVPPNSAKAMLAVSSTLGNSSSSLEITGARLLQLAPSFKGRNITASVRVPEDGGYSLYVRLLESRMGGAARFYLDGKELGEARTFSYSNRLQWERAYSGNLSKGLHTLTVESESGFNALNIAYLAPDGQEQPDLSGKAFIYRLTGKNDFSGSSVRIYGNSTSSTFFTLASALPVSSSFHIYRPGQYSVSASAEGLGSVLIDNASVANGTAYLAAGRHDIQVTPAEGSTLLLDHVTLASGSVPVRKAATIINQTRIDPSTYSVFVESEQPFWLVFGRGNDANWLAHADGTTYKGVSAFAAANAYYINKSGTIEVRIEYEGQKYVYAGAALGILGVLALGWCSWRFPA